MGTREPRGEKKKKKKGKNQVMQVGEGGKALWNRDCREGLWERQAEDKTTQNGEMLLDSISIRCTNTHIYILLAWRVGHGVRWQRDGTKKASRRKGPLKTTWHVDTKG